MRGYTETEVMDPSDVRLFRTAQQMVDVLPDMPGLRCHEVARAVGSFLGLQVVDGFYRRSLPRPVDHSWLVIPKQKQGHNAQHLILDVYAVARLPLVQLVDPSLGLNYEWRNERTDIKEDVVELLKQILLEAGFDE